MQPRHLSPTAVLTRPTCLPWATNPEESVVGSPADYREALEAAGFILTAEQNRRDFAREFFSGLKATVADPKGPPPLGLHIVTGMAAPVKTGNMIENITKNWIAPVELIVAKPA